MTDVTASPRPNPPVKGGVVAYLTVDGATDAAAFYAEAFGAEIANIYPPDAMGRTMHVHLYINGSSVMLSDFFPEQGFPKLSPQTFSMMLVVPDADAAFDKAIGAGAEVKMPLADMFWGDRYGQVQDRFGIIWGINGPVSR